jgi:hypothetical protein
MLLLFSQRLVLPACALYPQASPEQDSFKLERFKFNSHVVCTRRTSIVVYRSQLMSLERPCRLCKSGPERPYQFKFFFECTALAGASGFPALHCSGLSTSVPVVTRSYLKNTRLCVCGKSSCSTAKCRATVLAHTLADRRCCAQ